MHAAYPIDSRRNILGFLFDIATFVTGLAFIPTATVLVGLASQLTENKALIGVMGMVFTVGWYLPQLLAADIVRGKTEQLRYVKIASIIGRPMFLLIALWLLFTRAENPLLTIWIIIGGIFLFNVCDALAGVAWFDVMSRALSSRLRSRVITIGQIISGVLGLIISEAVKRILADTSIPFPINYAYLFFGTFVCMSIAFGGLLVLREIPQTQPEGHAEKRQNLLQSLRWAWSTDERFRRVIIVRFLTGIEAMSAAFYLVFVKERYALGARVDGEFTQAIILGGLIGVAIFGWLADRYTPRSVVHGSSLLYFLAPALAAVVALSTPPEEVAYVLFVAIFFFRGALDHTLVLGLLGYLLDATPEQDRALYVGALNTLGGLVSITPFLGGLFIDAFGTSTFTSTPYAILFVTVATSAAIGLAISLKLQKVQTV